MLLRAAQMSVKAGDGTPLHGACKMNADFSKIEFLSKEHPVVALAKDYYGRTPVSILWNNLPEINQAEFSNVIFSAREEKILLETCRIGGARQNSCCGVALGLRSNGMIANEDVYMRSLP